MPMVSADLTSTAVTHWLRFTFSGHNDYITIDLKFGYNQISYQIVLQNSDHLMNEYSSPVNNTVIQRPAESTHSPFSTKNIFDSDFPMNLNFSTAKKRYV